MGSGWLAGVYEKIADNYVAAIKTSGVKILLYWAVWRHMGTGAGPVDGLAYLESKINELDVNAVHLRPLFLL